MEETKGTLEAGWDWYCDQTPHTPKNILNLLDRNAFYMGALWVFRMITLISVPKMEADRTRIEKIKEEFEAFAEVTRKEVEVARKKTDELRKRAKGG